MEHVRLPLVSLEYILKEVVEEPLLKNSPKCMYFINIPCLKFNLFFIIVIFLVKDYINEALDFHKLKTQQVLIIPQTIRSTPRLSGYKV